MLIFNGTRLEENGLTFECDHNSGKKVKESHHISDRALCPAQGNTSSC
jgi:hypothetical protein